MRNAAKAGREARTFHAGLALVLVLMAALFWNGLTMTARAESKGTVTANSARIRQAAGTNSEAVGSVLKDATVTIISETQGTDGYVWYQIQAADGTKGYIRSDLVSKSAGNDTGITNPPVLNPSVTVEDVQPVGATITGGSPVRVRVDASTAASSSIITTLSNGTGITVNGRATGSDNNIWYLVTFVSNNTEIQGFVRSDYVSLSGELLPVIPEEPGTQEPGTQTPEVEEPVKEPKIYETAQDSEGTWCLYDYENNNSYPIKKLLESNANSADKIMASAKTIKTQKIVITILVILLVLAILAAALFFYKIRDLRDDAYFTAVEKQTLKERDSAKRPVGQKANHNRVMPTVGAANGKPAGQKTVQKSSVQPQGGNRPAGQANPARTTNPSNQARPANPAKPTVNGKPAPSGDRTMPQGQNRPVNKAPVQQPRPVSISEEQPKVDAQKSVQGQNPVKTASQPAPMPQEKPKAPVAAPAEKKANSKPEWKSKNFMQEEDDEFEFEFLNWDGEEK